MPVEGNVVVAGPGQVPAASQLACTQGVTPLATWLLAVSIAGNTVAVPIYLLPTAGATACLLLIGPAILAPAWTGRRTAPQWVGWYLAVVAGSVPALLIARTSPASWTARESRSASL